MKYNPNKPLTDEEQEKLGKEDFEGFLEYLDGMQEHKQKNFKKKVQEFKEKKRDTLRKTGITKIKTNRDQWFD
jgi:molecular chaperone GrpE (heat shock protein)